VRLTIVQGVGSKDYFSLLHQMLRSLHYERKFDKVFRSVPFVPCPDHDLSADKESIQLSSVKNVHVVAELFKQLLVALPEPPFPFEVYDFVMWTIGD
jgi:hypothetical protein